MHCISKFKITKPAYLKEHIHPLPTKRTIRYERSFFPYCQLNWVNIDKEIRNSLTIDQFKTKYLKEIRPPSKSYFGIEEKYGVSLLLKLRVDFSDLRKHRFNHNFNCVSPTCKCNEEEESTEHFLLRCPIYVENRKVLLSSISNIVRNDFTVLPDEYVVRIALYGSNVFNAIANQMIIKSTINYIRKTKRFKNLEAFST